MSTIRARLLHPPPDTRPCDASGCEHAATMLIELDDVLLLYACDSHGQMLLAGRRWSGWTGRSKAT